MHKIHFLGLAIHCNKSDIKKAKQRSFSVHSNKLYHLTHYEHVIYVLDTCTTQKGFQSASKWCKTKHKTVIIFKHFFQSESFFNATYLQLRLYEEAENFPTCHYDMPTFGSWIYEHS